MASTELRGGGVADIAGGKVQSESSVLHVAFMSTG